MRLCLIGVPIVAWLIWAEVARRRGKPMGSTPWAWLIAAGLLLAAVSLIAGGLIYRPDPTAEYVPEKVGADGGVIPGAR